MRVWGCDTADAVETPAAEDIAEENVNRSESPSASVVDGGEGNRRTWSHQVGEATSPWPERACMEARKATDGYALWNQHAVTNDSGCSCVREQKPD